MATIRYWAAARDAAGCAEEPTAAENLSAALDAARRTRDARFSSVLERSSYLVDGDPVGRRAHEVIRLSPESVVEVLPPFAGG